jgi:uncharacterized protein with HEPN domain
MQLEVKKYLADAQQAIGRIREFTSGQSFEEYSSNAMLRSAVERQFEIIGEALNRISKVDALLLQRISDSRRIIAFRNILIHGYDAIDDAVVWDVIEHYVPVLDSEVAVLFGD